MESGQFIESRAQGVRVAKAKNPQVRKGRHARACGALFEIGLKVAFGWLTNVDCYEKPHSVHCPGPDR